MTDAPVLLYLHIPKTGGSTLGSILFEQYHDDTWRKEERGFFRSGMYYLPDGFLRGEADGLTEEETRIVKRPDLTAVLGHFAYGIHETIGRPAHYITVLRDPVQRVLSLYHHLRQYNQLPEGISLKQFVTTPHVHEACNDQTRRLAGTQAGKPCDQATLDLAKSNLEYGIDVLGTTERFDATVLLAKRAFNWSDDTHYLPRLVRPTKPAEDPADVEWVGRYNALDIELYRYANALLDQRIADQGPGFHAELSAYTRKNQQLLKTHGPASTVS